MGKVIPADFVNRARLPDIPEEVWPVVFIFDGQAPELRAPSLLAEAAIHAAVAVGCRAIWKDDPLEARGFFMDPPIPVAALITSIHTAGGEGTNLVGVKPDGMFLIERARELGGIPIALFNDHPDAELMAAANPDSYRLLPRNPKALGVAVRRWLGEQGVARIEPDS